MDPEIQCRISIMREVRKGSREISREMKSVVFCHYLEISSHSCEDIGDEHHASALTIDDLNHLGLWKRAHGVSELGAVI